MNISNAERRPYVQKTSQLFVNREHQEYKIGYEIPNKTKNSSQCSSTDIHDVKTHRAFVISRRLRILEIYPYKQIFLMDIEISHFCKIA